MTKVFKVKYRGETKEVIVDDADGERLEQQLREPIMGRGGKPTKKARKLSYAPAWKNRGFRPALVVGGKLVYLTRWLLGLLDPAVSHLIVDHIDQNPLNNCRSNLRVVDKRINAMNCIAKREQATSSKYKGVCWSKQCNRWAAWILIPSIGGGKSTRMSKFFKVEDEAGAWRKEMEEKYYKPFMEGKNG